MKDHQKNVTFKKFKYGKHGKILKKNKAQYKKIVSDFLGFS